MSKEEPTSEELHILTPQQRLNLAIGNLDAASKEVRAVLTAWGNDVKRDATDPNLNALIEAHLLIANGIVALCRAQSQTNEAGDLLTTDQRDLILR